MKSASTAVLALSAVLFVSACAEIKETGKTIGHSTKEITTSIGHASRDAVKAVGESTSKVADDIEKELNK
ncbi:hypothetical protein MACH09_27170 [Vibrio sp. MACH09]|uniref:hypothetical protein n=1 Tax=unclassified Vibrio TaxID=2614977 RepID=UPI00149379EA|nr:MULTISPECIES: hypothetical protein [unclassified Vibrio]NOI66281.1 hypothetical protein [Vibrio sp. 99-8-1]GLO62209.1 hypothetical protein MACH09_27170 [Vibrio sp. MACH09]